MKDAQFWIDHLQLTAHPEGGFYKETYRSKEYISMSGLPERFSGVRNFSTAIYFLLRGEDKSKFHRIKSDELWHYHAGDSLMIYVLEDHQLKTLRLGPNTDQGDSLQIVIPSGCWFGAKTEQPDSYTLSGCTVAPGFDFRDFELANRKLLMTEYPAYRQVIEMLT
jgi:predicted cupin superfamily sugar epimerase